MIRFDLSKKDIDLSENNKVVQITDNKEKVLHILERFFAVESNNWVTIKSYLDTLVSSKKSINEIGPSATLLISSNLEKLRPILEENGVTEIQASFAETEKGISITLTILFEDGNTEILQVL